MTALGLPKRAVQFDLNLMLAPQGRGLTATLEYNASLFSPQTARRLAAAFVGVLERVAENPTIPLKRLGDATAVRGDRPAKDASRDRDARSLCELLEEQSALRGDATALVGTGGEEVGYRDLHRRANRLAQSLREHGVKRGAVVGVWMPLSVEQVVTAVAVLRSGAAYMPLDATHPRDRIITMLQDSGAKLVLSQDQARPDLPIEWMDPTDVDDEGHDVALPNVRARDLAYVMYTSGSTGRPKGVMVPHEAVVEQVRWRQREVPLRDTDRVLLLASPTFDISIWEMFGTLANGAALVIAPPEARQDHRRLLEFIRAQRITVLQLVSSVLAQLVDEPLLAECDSLRVIFCGGDELRADVAQRLAKISRAEVVHLYGPTEAVIDATYFRVPRQTQGIQRKVPIGSPIDGTHVQLFDNRLRRVQEGVTGELYIGGIGLGWGYLGQPGLTAEQFLPDPSGQGGRLYRTGDLARLHATGQLEFVGRRDDQVKIRGYRVELGEVETAIARDSTVRDQAVLSRESDGQTAIVAYVVPNRSRAPTPTGLRAHLVPILPEYMVPAEIVIVADIPRLPSGKVDRARLLSIAEARARDATRTGLLSHTEELVAEVWSDLLRLEDVPPTKNFFELGGHSLLVLQVAARLTSLTGNQVPVRAVFDNPTVRGLATSIAERERRDLCEAVPRLARSGAVEGPLSGSQEGLWTINELDPGSLAYAVPQAYRLEGRLDIDALQGAISELMRRHSSLRTTLSPSGETVTQVIGNHRPFTLPRTDLRQPDPRAARERLANLIRREAHQPFDLTRGPLFRIAVAEIADEEYALLINTHHIICDGWSQAVLLEDLSILYHSLVRGDMAPPSEPTFEYVDFARWESEWLTGDRRSRLADYWLTKLRSADSTHLPMERQVTGGPTEQGASCSALIATELVSRLSAFCREGNATLFMGLMATFAVLLHRYSGETDMVVGTPMSVRDLPELERVVGNFVNMLPLRISVSRSMTFRELLAGVREESLQSYAHRQFPFGWIVRELQPTRKPGAIPLISVLFQLQSQPLTVPNLPDIVATPIIEKFEVAPLYLNFTMTPRDKGLEARVDFATDRFQESTITGMLGLYQRILRGALSDPARRLGDLLGSLERSESGSLDDSHMFSFERE